MSCKRTDYLSIAITIFFLSLSAISESDGQEGIYYPRLWEESRSRIESFVAVYDAYTFFSTPVQNMSDEEIIATAVDLCDKVEQRKRTCPSPYDTTGYFKNKTLLYRYSLSFSPPLYRETAQLLYSTDMYATTMDAIWYNGEHVVKAYCPKGAPKTISEISILEADAWESQHAVDVIASGMYDKMWAAFPRIDLPEDDYVQIMSSTDGEIDLTFKPVNGSSLSRRVFQVQGDKEFVCPSERWFDAEGILHYLRLSTDFETIDPDLPPFPRTVIRWTCSHLVVFSFKEVHLNPVIEESTFSVAEIPGYDFSSATVEDKVLGIKYQWADQAIEK